MNGNTFEDMCWQQEANIMPLIGLVIDCENKRANGVVFDCACDGYLDLLVALKKVYFLYFAFDFVLIGVHGFEFQ